MKSIKEWMQRQIENGAVESELDGEKIILKKSRIPLLGGEWRQIYPPIDVDGKVNYFNLLFGGKRNFVILILISILAVMIFLQFQEMFKYIETLENNPCIVALKNNMLNG